MTLTPRKSVKELKKERKAADKAQAEKVKAEAARVEAERKAEESRKREEVKAREREAKERRRAEKATLKGTSRAGSSFLAVPFSKTTAAVPPATGPGIPSTGHGQVEGANVRPIPFPISGAPSGTSEGISPRENTASMPPQSRPSMQPSPGSYKSLGRAKSGLGLFGTIKKRFSVIGPPQKNATMTSFAPAPTAPIAALAMVPKDDLSSARPEPSAVDGPVVVVTAQPQQSPPPTSPTTTRLAPDVELPKLPQVTEYGPGPPSTTPLVYSPPRISSAQLASGSAPSTPVQPRLAHKRSASFTGMSSPGAAVATSPITKTISHDYPLPPYPSHSSVSLVGSHRRTSSSIRGPRPMPNSGSPRPPSVAISTHSSDTPHHGDAPFYGGHAVPSIPPELITPTTSGESSLATSGLTDLASPFVTDGLVSVVDSSAHSRKSSVMSEAEVAMTLGSPERQKVRESSGDTVRGAQERGVAL